LPLELKQLHIRIREKIRDRSVLTNKFPVARLAAEVDV